MIKPLDKDYQAIWGRMNKSSVSSGVCNDCSGRCQHCKCVDLQSNDRSQKPK